MLNQIRKLSIFFMVVTLAGGTTIGAALAADNFRVALVTPGSITDGSNNQAHYEGLKLIEKELGAETAFSEKVSQPDQEEYLTDYARRGYDLVIVHGGEFDGSALKVAKRFPKIKFVVTNGTARGPNISNATVNPKHYGYLCGVVGGQMTKTNKLAYISANEFALITTIYESIKRGAKDYNQDAEVDITYTGNWDDIAKAKEAAFANIAKGVDVLFPALDLAVMGVIEGAREKGVYAFGFVKDMLDVAPETILCSAIVNYSAVMLHVAKLAKENKFEGGESYVLGLETPGVTGIGRFNKKVPSEVRDLVKKVTQDIIEGKVKFN